MRWPSLLNLIGALKLSLLLKLPPRKFEPWFVLWSFFFLKLLCVSINLPYDHVWNTVVTFGVVPLFATWNCYTSCKNKYAGLFVPSLHDYLKLLGYCRNVAFSIGITLVDVPQNLLNWFHLFFEGDVLVILIDCMIFLSPFLDATRMSMLTVSFLAANSLSIECFPLT